MALAWEFRFREDDRILEAKTAGFATLPALSDFSAALLTAARSHAAARVLVDHRGLTGHDLDTFQIYGLPQRQQGQGATFTQRIAILFDPSTTFARDFEFYAARATNTGFNHQVFDDYEAALHWLTTGGPAVTPGPSA